MLGTTAKRADTSRQIEYENEFLSGPLSKAFIAPPYDIRAIANIYEKSNMLRQCVAAYTTNIAMYGWEIVQASPDTEMDANEVLELQSFIDRANADESLTTIHARLVDNFEKYGFGFLEIIRDRAGRISIIRNIKSLTTRLLPKNAEKVPITYDVARGKRTSKVTELRRFRPYAQIINGITTYFKEFGDPRRLDFRTGVYESLDSPVLDDDLSTELLHFRQESEDAYGVPRWISQLPSILGSREVEECNLRYF